MFLRWAHKISPCFANFGAGLTRILGQGGRSRSPELSDGSRIASKRVVGELEGSGAAKVGVAVTR